MISVHDLACYLIAAHLRKGEPDLNTMKLHKLAYLCQAYAMAWSHEPMFAEDVRAGTSGPVIDEFYEHHKGLYGVTSWPLGNAEHLAKGDKIVADWVIKAYGGWTGLNMSRLLLESFPWKKTWEKHTETDPTPIFDLSMLGSYYRALSDAPTTREEYAERFMDRYLEQDRL